MVLTGSAILLAQAAIAQVETDAIENPEDSAPKIGRWVKDGSPIKEYPVCYQLWKCESSKSDMGEAISLPKGEWGLCDNYTDTTQNSICTKCDAPPPIEVCE